MRLAIRQCLKDTQRPLEPASGVLKRRPRGSLLPGLPEIDQRVFPQFAPNGVVGEPLDFFTEAILVKCFYRVDDPRVQLAATLQQ
jgi:hypothetical protein